jgi:tRNA threonylcarbamoyladenosine biosynthesis protein TsaB
MADVLILAIETATGCGSVALTRGTGCTGKVLAEYSLQPEVSHARRLLGSVHAIMTAAGVEWKHLDGIAVSQGPGSFTGLRIGMAAAKGMAMAAGIPLLAVPTLDGLAAQVSPVDCPVCCLLDARKQQVYTALYRCEDKGHQRISSYLVLRPEEIVEHVQEPTLVVGPGVQACLPVLQGHPLVRLMSTTLLAPRAAAIGFCGGSQLTSGAGELSDHVTPLYVRASEAELNLRSNSQPMAGTR